MAKGQKKVLTEAEKAKKQEAKRAAFIRVVQPRVNKALKAIRLIGSCSSPNYLYTPEQVAAIEEVLVKAVAAVSEAFSKKATKPFAFSLPS